MLTFLPHLVIPPRRPRLKLTILFVVIGRPFDIQRLSSGTELSLDSNLDLCDDASQQHENVVGLCSLSHESRE